MPSARVLVVGAGIAGSITAFWLAKHDFQVVVIERAKAEQKLGQGLEIEEPALKVVKMMGVLDELNERKTAETGFNLVDEQSRSYAFFEIGGGISPTGALELMRGDLVEILYKAADASPNVTYRFENTLKGLRQSQDKVMVDLESKITTTTRVEEFDFVVGADGVKSRTRQLAMGSPEELSCFKHVGAFVSYFSIPKQDRDWPYSRLCHFTDRRILWTRPTAKNSNVTSVALIHVKDDVPALRQANAAGDRRKQKEAFAEVYRGLGWETPRVMAEMMKAENFYSDELVQVKLPKWSQNRVVLVGDAAWAPTPFTGEGNQLAIIGAWVLAQEMSRNRRDPAAFDMYETRLRSYVEKAQGIPLGGYAPYLFVPQTAWGIWLFRTIFSLLAWASRMLSKTNLLKMLPDQAQDAFDLQIKEDEVEMTR